MTIQQFTEKHKILALIIFWGFLILLAWWLMTRSNNSSPDLNMADDAISENDCLMERVTLESLKNIASNEGINITQRDVDWVNKKPLCKDICSEQKRYAAEYPSEWYADDGIRAICKKIGLPLP